MPDGITHHKIHKQGSPLAVTLAIATLFLFWDFSPPLGVLIGYFLGRWIDPDLDQIGTTAAEGRMVNELPVIGWFFYGWWSVYGAIFRRHHRSFWTHFPGASTLIRMIWGFWWVVLPVYFGWIKNGWDTSLFLLMVGVFIGQTLADTLHYLADIRSGEIKR